MDKRKIQIVVTAVAVFICGIVYLMSGAGKSPEISESFTVNEAGLSDSQAGSSVSQGAAEIYVYVCGEVKAPGVYKFDSQPRAVDAVEAAGGLTKKADGESVNLALKLSDGDMLSIPKKKKASDPSGEVAASAGSQDNKININTADKSELMRLAGIGEAKAESIISYRTEHGAFNKIEDIKNISGIKDGVYNKIKNDITV